jgi:hypothetical protein
MSKKTERTFPREVVISPGWGAGIATWIHDGSGYEDFGYDVAEHPEVIAWVKNGRGKKVGTETANELVKRLWPDVEYICTLGFEQAEVVTVHSPYKIDEYDGFESVTESGDLDVWRY